MKLRRTCTWMAAAAVFATVLPRAASAQWGSITSPRAVSMQASAPAPETVATPQARFAESDWSGPRMGMMFAPGDAAISRRLREHGLGSTVSQFGWHFEHRVVPFGNGPQLVTEFIPLFGGVEYGKFVPSLTAAMGVRFRSGWELGMGPNVKLTNQSGGTNTSLVLAAGKSLDYGEVSIPFNVAVSTNTKGTMITLLVGYAIHQAKS